MTSSPGSAGEPDAVLHAVLVSVNGIGVLLTGEAGTGKSSCALELLARGHRLVADDVVEARRQGQVVIGTAPKRFAGLLHVRGLGLIDCRGLFGPDAYLQVSEIRLCVELGITAPLDDDTDCQEILGVQIPRNNFPAHAGGERAVFIETAVKLATGVGRASVLTKRA